MVDGIHHVLGRFDYIAVLLAIGRGQGEQHALEAGTALIILRRKVSSTKEGTSIRSKEGSQRPTALSANGLHCGLIAAVHIGTLVTIDFDRDIVFVDELCDFRILV